MDGRGRWKDSVFIGRLWKSVTYEEVYLMAHESVSEARAALGRYFVFTTVAAPFESWWDDPGRVLF